MKSSYFKGLLQSADRYFFLINGKENNSVNFKHKALQVGSGVSNQINTTSNANQTILFSNNILRVVGKNDLIKFMNTLETNDIDEHYKNGLPKNIEKQGTISVLLNTNYHDKKSLKYHCFNKFSNPPNPNQPPVNQLNNKPMYNKDYTSPLEYNLLSNNRCTYDIPFYFYDAPPNFSIFCTTSEKEMALNYIKQKQSNSENPVRRSRIDAEELNVLKQPAPRKEHNYCHLCGTKYVEYFKHLEDEIHLAKIKYNTNLYQQINDVFGRVRNYWKEEEDRKKKLEMEEKLSEKLSENLEILEVHINDENNLFKNCNEEEDLNFIHTHTNDEFSTKFATNTNAVMNNDIEVQITNNNEDDNQIKISEKAIDKISEFVIEIKKEKKDNKAAKDQTVVMVPQARSKHDVSLREERDLPTQFIDNDEKMNTLINTDNKCSKSTNFIENKNSSIKSKGKVPLDNQNLKPSIEKKEEAEVFTKRKFSQLVNKSSLDSSNKFIPEINNNKYSHKKFKKILAFRHKHTRDISGLINSIDNLKNLVNDSFSMKLK